MTTDDRRAWPDAPGDTSPQSDGVTEVSRLRSALVAAAKEFATAAAYLMFLSQIADDHADADARANEAMRCSEAAAAALRAAGEHREASDPTTCVK
jgi:uncharacterized membrane protein